jgi:hypothetical protein
MATVLSLCLSLAGTGRNVALRDTEKNLDLRRRAEEVRAIAKGIFDQRERQTLLEFVDDCEKLFVERELDARQS